jgi:thiol-disulfide isomerase/thioredoxin
MLALLIFAFPKKAVKPFFKREKWLAAGFGVVALVATLVVSPPDMFFRLETSANNVNQVLLQKIKTENNIEKDKKMLCFFGTFCKYCKLSANRIAAFSKNGQIQSSNIHFVFVGDTASVKQFMHKTDTEGIDFSIIPPAEFLEFTNGRMPTIILQNSDSVVGKLGYRSLTEENLKVISSK